MNFINGFLIMIISFENFTYTSYEIFSLILEKLNISFLMFLIVGVIRNNVINS